MKARIEGYIKLWENRCYKELPDQAPITLERINKVPSYRSIAMAIINNDHTLKSLGYTPKKSKYYNMLKRDELIKRGVIIQLQLKL